MNTYKARIVQADSPILEGITVYLEVVTEASGLKSWYGAFGLPRGEYIDPGGPYRLELEEGGGGEILITNVTVSSNSPTQVAFQGTGAFIPGGSP
jgi:hypothetical protein